MLLTYGVNDEEKDDVELKRVSFDDVLVIAKLKGLSV